MTDKARIMIVEDDEVSLGLINSCLLKLGYDCLAVSDSRKAVEVAKNSPPDLFLLDLMMPHLGGVELCRSIKKENNFKDTPVIFLTAVEDTAQKVDAFSAGAVDYITKPINIAELTVRIKTHLELFFARKKVEEYGRNMEKLAGERAKQLLHADRLALLGTLAAGLAHEVNNPATFISGNVQTLEKFWEIIGREIAPSLRETSADKEKLEFISSEMPHLIAGMKEGVSRIKKIVDSLTFFARREGKKKEPVKLSDCARGALELCQKILKDRIKVEQRIDNSLAVFSDAQQIEQVLVNLIVNAADATEGVPEALLKIEVFRDKDMARVIVSDNGPGVPADILTKIWDPFFTTKEPGKGTGLGLSIVRSIIEAHGGRIEASNRKEGGLSVDIVLPLDSSK